VIVQRIEYSFLAAAYLISTSIAWFWPCCTQQGQRDPQLEVGHSILGDIVNRLLVVLHGGCRPRYPAEQQNTLNNTMTVDPWLCDQRLSRAQPALL
jgi:hypothetical protein